MPIIKRLELLNALDAVKGAVAAKPFSPILTHVLIEGDVVLAFDSEIGIRYKLTTDTGCNFNARFDMLHNLMKSLSGEEVDITIVDKKVHFRCGRHKSFLTQIVDEPFPRPLIDNSSAWHEVPKGFKEALERCLLAVSDSEQNKVLSAVLIRGGTLFATDRNQLVRCKVDELNLEPMLLTKKAVEEIIRLGQPMRVAVSDSLSVWDYGNLTLLARLREGVKEYPPVDKLFERLKAVPDQPIPDGMVAILQRLSYFGSDKDKVVRISKGGLSGVELVARNETSEAIEYLDPDENMPTKTFDPRRLERAIPYADTMTWGFTNEDCIHLRGASSGFEFVLMPMVNYGN